VRAGIVRVDRNRRPERSLDHRQQIGDGTAVLQSAFQSAPLFDDRCRERGANNYVCRSEGSSARVLLIDSNTTTVVPVHREGDRLALMGPFRNFGQDDSFYVTFGSKLNLIPTVYMQFDSHVKP